MRTLSLILGIAFVLAGSSFAGSPTGSLPGIGTFAYNGSQIDHSPAEIRVMAAR